MHWSIIIVFLKSKIVLHYDSLGTDEMVGRKVIKFLDQDTKTKNISIVGGEWKLEIQNTPKQINGNDCGVFSSQFAECIARNVKPSFEQKDMSLLRRKMLYEILALKIEE